MKRPELIIKDIRSAVRECGFTLLVPCQNKDVVFMTYTFHLGNDYAKQLLVLRFLFFFLDGFHNEECSPINMPVKKPGN